MKKGIKAGAEQERERIALSLLQEGMDEAFVLRVTQLTQEALKQASRGQYVRRVR